MTLGCGFICVHPRSSAVELVVFGLRLATIAIALALAQFALPAQAQPASVYPNKPVRLIVPFAPGATDAIARIVAKKLTEAWGQQFVIDHRPGAGGALGTELTARAAPDGYTLMLGNPGPRVHSVLLRKHPTYALAD